MQSNLATEIILKLKKRIKVLIAAVIILSVICAGLLAVMQKRRTNGKAHNV